MTDGDASAEIFYRRHPSLTGIGRRIVDAAVRKFGTHGLRRDRLALTLIVPERAHYHPFGWNHRGERPIYPASVVKLFYLVAVHAWLAEGRLQRSEEIDRALVSMIRESSNDATNYLVDALTRTTGGLEVPSAALRRWLHRRQAVNRYFARWSWPEFAGINVCQKT